MSELSIDQLEAQAVAGPLAPDVTIALIEKLRTATPRNEGNIVATTAFFNYLRFCCMLIDKLRTYRELFVSTHLTYKEFWQQWLSDAMELGNVDLCTDLFNEALASVPDFEITSAFIDFCSALVEAEKMVSATPCLCVFIFFTVCCLHAYNS